MTKNNYDNWTKEELINEVKALKKQKTYGLVWEEDKTKEAFDYYINWEGEKNKESFGEEEGKFPVLKEIENKSIDNGDSKYNLIIEGDNYHSLAVLNFTHNKKVDVIYIDPPYNTGNKDFIYNDKIVDKEDGFKHSKWLSFMSKRLKLSKNLLNNTGVIFISIDDNEFAQLKILCDDIFGEQNFIANFVWNSTKSITNPALVSVSHTYTLAYARNKSVFDLKYRKNFKLPAILDGFSNPDDDPRGLWKADPFEAGGVRKNQMYPIKNPNTGEVFYPNKGNCWKNDLKKFEELIKDNRIVFGKDGKGRPQRKRFIWEAEERGLTPNTWWDDVGTTTNGTMELKKIFGEAVFNNPKPVSLIKKILILGSKKDSIVLDFFAGSGTTGHAVMELNKEDGGRRKFILCTNNESNNGSGLKIATDICYPRIKKIIEGYKDNKSNKVEGYNDNLKYFRTDFVDSSPTDQNKKKMVVKSTEMLCIKENAFKLIKEKEGYKIFKNTDIHLGIIFDEDDIDSFISDAKEIKGKFNVYVFSLDDSVPEREFRSMKGKVKLCPIPEAILHVYRRIFK